MNESLRASRLVLPVMHDVGLEGLPLDWATLTIEDQQNFLTHNQPLLPTPTFVCAGLEVGARRLEVQNDTEDHIDHVQILDKQIGSVAARQAFLLGQSDNMRAGRAVASADASTLWTIIKEQIGPEFLNTRLINDMQGRNRFTATNQLGKLAAVTPIVHKTIVAEKWPDHLYAFAGLQHMYQSACRGAKEITESLLLSEGGTTGVKSQLAETFWQSKIAGVEGRLLGVAYYMGYRELAGDALRFHMGKEWGDDYAFNRNTFTGALNLRIHGLSEFHRAKVQKTTRQPVFALIKAGNFPAAREILRQTVIDRAELFSPRTQRELLRNDM